MISSAMEVLGKDGVVAFPTDTLYGIATRITSVKGYRRIYDIKGREQSKPVAICFASFEQLVRWMPHLTGYPVINALLPGPVTIVLPRTDEIPPHVNPLCDWIGVRIPDNLLAQQLSAEEPLCLTSANKSGHSSAITANDFAGLHDRLDIVVDGGRIDDSKQSR